MREVTFWGCPRWRSARAKCCAPRGARSNFWGCAPSIFLVAASCYAAATGGRCCGLFDSSCFFVPRQGQARRWCGSAAARRLGPRGCETLRRASSSGARPCARREQGLFFGSDPEFSGLATGVGVYAFVSGNLFVSLSAALSSGTASWLLFVKAWQVLFS